MPDHDSNGPTRTYSGDQDTADTAEIEFADHPKSIGRYRVESVLGKGGFGLVYLAHDDQLHRRVAVKVPHARLVSQAGDAEAYLAEARMVANLDHPHIVPVYDVGSVPGFPCFIVSKYIEGSDLATWLECHLASPFEAAELVATVAEALHYAHKQGLVHRDVKTRNILVGTNGQPYLVDFGLALREENIGKGPRYAGTPRFMSPEQARGEGHRVDGRSDIFSLAAVFYELITRRRAFSGKSNSAILEEVATRDPKPPRQIDDRIPRELERICLKALSKRASERYTAALDMAQDLQHFLASCSVESGSAAWSPPGSAMKDGAANSSSSVSRSEPIRIVPKGLRSFDAHDADFFLELLPGPRSRERLPESIRFWKRLLEETDPDQTFTVGLIYGPSGCGKSSFVKAGLLPRLSDQVIPVYVECGPDETESRLLQSLRKQAPGGPSEIGLTNMLARLRQGSLLPAGRKVLIVLDQFEQWLHAERDDARAELVRALRQCDGAHVQCVVLVRDDFWLAVSRFFHELEVRLIEGSNSALVDLFDDDHARRVLTAFGRAFGKLPENAKDMTREQQDFITRSITGLSVDNRVICVRLALYAEMMKGKSWTPTTLREVGGTEGVGRTFLEETFSASTAPPEHRYHQAAARRVLKALLPTSTTDIRGQMRSHDELLLASGYAERPEEFDDLLTILDSEVRLITPTVPETAENGDSHSLSEPSQRYYQLTHDYLIHPLRNWLTRKQRESRRGRALLRLEESSSWWNSKPETRRLPSLGEFLSIRLWTRSSDWERPQRAMMQAASRFHARRCCMWGLASLVLLAIAVQSVHWIERSSRQAHAEQLVTQLWQIDFQHLPAHLQRMSAYGPEWIDEVRAVAESADSPPDRRLRAQLALEPESAAGLDFLRQQLLSLNPEDLFGIMPELETVGPRLVDSLPEGMALPDLSSEQQLMWAALLTRHSDSDAVDDELTRLVVSNLVQSNPVDMPAWLPAFEAVAEDLVSGLEDHFRSSDADRRYMAALLLASLLDRELASPAPAGLASFLLDADPRQFRVLMPSVGDSQADGLVPFLSDAIAEPVPPTSDAREQLLRQQSNAAAALMHLGRAEAFWPLLSRETPDLRTRLMHQMAAYGIPWQDVLEQIQITSNADIRQAAVLSLSSYPDVDSEARITSVLQDVLNKETDAGVFVAVEWLFRTRLRAVDAEPTIRAGAQTAEAPENSAWWLTPAGQTMINIPAPGLVQIGSPATEKGRDGTETLREVYIESSFAISSAEVTVAQYLEYDSGFQFAETVTRSHEAPVTRISYYDAMRYCRWLSEQAGIDDSQMCYPELSRIGAGMSLPDDFLQRSGYRLPSEAEWEYVARADCKMSRFFGSSEEYLDRFAWYAVNADESVWPVAQLKPNMYGLFDIYGNVAEWCHSSEVSTGDRRQLSRGGDYRSTPRFLRSAMPTWQTADITFSTQGFRIARTLPTRIP